MYKENSEITGIVLAGGKSSRFGTDKALAVFQGKTLIEHAVSIISPLCDQLLISANGPEYNFLNLPVISDIYTNAGPMGGLHASLNKSTTRTNLIITTDTPFLNTELYAYLLKKHSNHLLTLASRDGFIHPLCGIYSKDTLPEMEKSLKNRNFKMMKLVNEINPRIIEITDEHDFYSPRLFDNINRVEDLK